MINKHNEGNRIDIKPLSVNTAWQGKRFKTKDYKDWLQEISYLLPKTIKGQHKKKKSMSIVFAFSSKRSDIDNPIKTLLDALQQKYDFNDSEIYKLEVIKKIVKKGKEYIEFNIE